MEQYIKQFTNNAAYNAVKDNLDRPNVVLCTQENEIHYNPIETNLVLTFNIEDLEYPTRIIGGYGEAENVSKIYVDGVEIDPEEDIINGQNYQFDTLGTHIVKIELTDPTYIPGSMINGLYKLTKLYIPDSVTELGYTSIWDCSQLTTIRVTDSLLEICSQCNFGQLPNLDTATRAKLYEHAPQYGWGSVVYCD